LKEGKDTDLLRKEELNTGGPKSLTEGGGYLFRGMVHCGREAEGPPKEVLARSKEKQTERSAASKAPYNPKKCAEKNARSFRTGRRERPLFLRASLYGEEDLRGGEKALRKKRINYEKRGKGETTFTSWVPHF